MFNANISHEPNELVSVYSDLPFPVHERNGSGVIEIVGFGAVGVIVVAVTSMGNVVMVGNVVVVAVVVVAVVVVAGLLVADVYTNMVCAELAAVFCCFSQTQSEKRGRIELSCCLPAMQLSLPLQVIVDSR